MIEDDDARDRLVMTTIAGEPTLTSLDEDGDTRMRVSLLGGRPWIELFDDAGREALSTTVDVSDVR